ncbi:MAG TPA: cobalamin B12-binding domain-containing protein [Steroidobacteraceae bacterium]|nr:cobalamin B12-binding domain-containing protein [Steroidobacteraceae bacterium]
MYSIKAVSQATGLTVETLRAWERRYRAVVPQRDDMGRRVYRAEDVLRLRRLREATERGHPIGRLVHLDETSLARLLHEPERRPPSVMATTFVERILDAARRYSPAECEQALTLAVSLMSPARLIHGVLEPLLREVGDRWHVGEFSIAQERLVSSTVRRHIGLIVETYARTAERRQSIVFATLPGERHELGLLMSAMVCASRGFKIHYLGPDVPAQEIARYAREIGAALVALSVLLLEGAERLPADLAMLRDGLGPDVPIWVGGHGAQAVAREALPTQCLVVADQTELQQRLDVLPR